MKKWFFLFTLTLLIIVCILYLNKPSSPDSKNVLAATEELTITPTPSIWKQSDVIDFNDTPIRVSWVKLKPANVELFDNLKDQHLSEQIKVDRSCSALVNGGFYSKENTHLGLFVSNFEESSQPISSALLDGFLWISSDGKANISFQGPSTTPRLGLQTGPILIINKEFLKLDIKNDDTNRRIVAAISSKNDLYFLAIYKDGSELQGPLLGNLPDILDVFAKRNGIDIRSAINLDGGIHSVFISNYDRLSEFAHIGSYFCAK